MQKVLITGADGFIGRYLVRKLLKEGKEVYAIVYPGNNIYEVEQNEKLYVNYIDLNQVMNYVSEFPNDIDVMYHFAWIGVQPEKRNEFDIQMMNVNMTIECMKFASSIEIKKIVLPGSTSEYLYYGKAIDKNAIPSPKDAYGAVKIALRYLCGNYSAHNDIQFVYAIITGIYAADRRDNNVIFYTIDKLLHNEKPLLTRLEQLWDYVYIDDVVDALMAIGNSGKDGAVYAWSMNSNIFSSPGYNRPPLRIYERID